MRYKAVVASATVGLLVLAGCTNADESVPPFDAGPGPSYVAIGDSYTSGPGIDEQLVEGGLCLRSDHNYPRLLAQHLNVSSFADVSCAGATTSDALNDKVTPSGKVIPAQLDALSADTDLVTIGLGANDGGLFSTLFGACRRSDGGSSRTCRTFVRDTEPTLLAEMHDQLVAVVSSARARAPKAQIILVGYLRVLPDSGGCNSLPVAPEDLEFAIAGATALDTALRGVADDVGVPFLSMRDAGIGHDACAGTNAWVNGVTASPGNGIVVHPRLAGMQAVADRLAALID